MAYVKNAIYLPLDSLLERNGYRLNAQKSTKIWKVYGNSNEKLLVRQNANFQWFYFNCDNKADSGNIINFCKNRNLDLMGFAQGLIINDDTIKENTSKLTSKEADKFKEQQKIIDTFNQFELYDLTNSKMLEKRKLNGNLFLVYNHSLKRDKHNNMCVSNFLYSKNSHSNEIISYTRRLENPMTSLNNQVLNRPINALNKGEKGIEMLAPKDLKLIKNIVLSESIIDSMSYLQLRKLNAYESILLSCNGQFNANKLDAFLEKLLSDIEQSKSKEYADYLKKVQSFELYKGTQTRTENKTNTTRDNLTIHFSRAKYPSSTDFMPAKDWVNESVKSLDELVKVITNYHYSSAIYKNNYRNTHNTKGFSNLLIFDIDNDKDKPNISLEETKNLFKKHGIETLIIPSRNHNKEKHGHIAERFRIIIPTQQTIGQDFNYNNDFSVFNNFCAKALGIYDYIDKKVSVDQSRAYYKSPNDTTPIILKGRIMDITHLKQQAMSNLFTQNTQIQTTEPEPVNKPDLSLNIVLAYDNDKNGQIYTQISEEIIYKHTENMPNVFIPYSKDCNDDLKLANLIGNDHINNEMIKNFLERIEKQSLFFDGEKKEKLEALKNECLALLKPQEQTNSQNNAKENEKPIQGVDYEM
ncbi:toprim domain-containing protein [Helicobacter pylori]|uniref:toprim domain-containing protein n=1 Tax=Helicobacter pylori TaxID=210 RepID=UPI003F93D464